MTNNDYLDTIIAPITSSVGASIAMLRISGKKAISIVNDFFPTKDLKKFSGGRFFFGALQDEQNNIIDEVILLLYKAPNSFTGEDVIEISFHSNPLIIDKALQLFRKAGCRLAEPGEFSKRAFLNGKIDLIQAEAIAGLIAAKSQAAVKNSLQQLSGKFSSAIGKIKENLIKTASLLELDLDFSEEDLEIISPEKIKNDIKQLIEEIDRFINSYQKGRILTQGINVLITGKPNVGKSSLMNAFLNKDRVIVSSMPGTTRDIVHEEIYIKNILVRFIDSAGIHLAENALEAEGIERARDYFEKADLLILLIDVSEKINKDDENLLKSIYKFYKNKLVIAGNKIDLHKNTESIRFLKEHNRPLYLISAKFGTNIEMLKNDIPEFFLKDDASPAEEIFISDQRQLQMLEKAKSSLLSAASSLKKNMGYEFVAVDIRDAISHLSSLTGEITADDILNNIFSGFCIGK